MAIPISEGLRPSRRIDCDELKYTLLYLLKKKLPWSKVKGKTHIIKCKKMCEAKRNIKYMELFKDLPDEFIYIYKNIRKLNFDEKPEYGLYILLFENILRKLNVNYNELSNFCFPKKIDNFIAKTYLSKILKTKIIKDFNIFNGYPIKIF